MTWSQSPSIRRRASPRGGYRWRLGRAAGATTVVPGDNWPNGRQENVVRAKAFSAASGSGSPRRGRPARAGRSTRHQGGRLVLKDLTVPLVTLLGLADRPGEGHRLGVLDPELGRELADLAVASSHSRCASRSPIRMASPSAMAGAGRKRAPLPVNPAGAPPSPVALPARLNLTITADRLSAMLPRTPGHRASPACGRRPRGCWPGAMPTARRARQARRAGARGSPADPDWCGNWTLTVPGGRELTVRIEPVPTDECDHRYESHGYQPNDTLRHLIQVRDYTCTFPPCSRHARESDFVHPQPYDKSGRTCACNAGARSRKCHRVKQSPGWQVTQPRPGWHEWTTPTGRTYIQPPYRYPV